VVSRPFFDGMGVVPVLRSMKLPVPYVFFAVPTSKHAWPNVAACWSPRMPEIGTPGTIPPSRP